MGLYQVTQKDGKRHSTARAFLTPVKLRANLIILSNAEVLHLDQKDGQATGITLRHQGQTQSLQARAGVILSPEPKAPPISCCALASVPQRKSQPHAAPPTTTCPG